MTKNNKFAISLQYFKKKVSYKVDKHDLHVDKHCSFLQIDIMISDGDGQASKNVISQKRSDEVNKVDILHGGKHQSFVQADFMRSQF